MICITDFLNAKAHGVVQWLKKPDDSVAELRTVGIYLLNLGIWSAVWWQHGKLDRMYDKLDTDKSIVFTSVSDCVANNYTQADCQCSWEQAKHTADKIGFKYISAGDAARHHQDYREVTYTEYNRVLGGNRSYNRYEPVMTGWQASYHNICDASAPVYSGPKPGTHVRSDGHLINCACPTNP